MLLGFTQENALLPSSNSNVFGQCLYITLKFVEVGSFLDPKLIVKKIPEIRWKQYNTKKKKKKKKEKKKKKKKKKKKEFSIKPSHT